jgi:hypothetical protein
MHAAYAATCAGKDLDASIASETGVVSRSEKATGFVLQALLARVLIESVGEMHIRHAIVFHMVRCDLSVHVAKAWRCGCQDMYVHQGPARFPQPHLGLEYRGSVVSGSSPQYIMCIHVHVPP